MCCWMFHVCHILEMNVVLFYTHELLCVRQKDIHGLVAVEAWGQFVLCGED